MCLVSWSRFDDLYDDHPKVMAATHACALAAALHPQAITASSRRESDGLVDPFWLLARAPERKRREEALEVLVGLALFDLLPAGETRTLADAAGFSVVVGPFSETRYLVHDYLDYNPSSTQLQDRRRKDAERKASGRRKDSHGIPDGVRADVSRTPDGPRGSAGADPRPTPHPSPIPSHPKPPTAGADETGLASTVTAVVGLLEQCSRIHVDRVGVENAISAWPGRDPQRAARTVVTWVSDPAFRSTNGAKLLGDALSKQNPGSAQAAAPVADFSKYDRAGRRPAPEAA